MQTPRSTPTKIKAIKAWFSRSVGYAQDADHSVREPGEQSGISQSAGRSGGVQGRHRRLASSVPANIAEGCGADGDTELARYCRIARASASELEYHVLLAHDLQFIPVEIYEQMNARVVELKRMLTGLIQKLSAER